MFGAKVLVKTNFKKKFGKSYFTFSKKNLKVAKGVTDNHSQCKHVGMEEQHLNSVKENKIIFQKEMCQYREVEYKINFLSETKNKCFWCTIFKIHGGSVKRKVVKIHGA